MIGQPAFAIERLWQAMFRNEFARGGPILNSAIGAIEMALWDILGKALGRPVHALLGGRVHERLPAYANAWYGAGASAGRDRRRRGRRSGKKATAGSSSTRSRARAATRSTRWCARRSSGSPRCATRSVPRWRC